MDQYLTHEEDTPEAAQIHTYGNIHGNKTIHLSKIKKGRTNRVGFMYVDIEQAALYGVYSSDPRVGISYSKA